MSGRVMGAHQKIDRIARRHLAVLLGTENIFPSIKNILLFEGKNGPDGIKRKSPAQDEPWHYFSPFDDADVDLSRLINHHYDLLVEQLKKKNMERASFEAAWLAHAIVDGLTPAHHYPYEDKLIELRGGKGIETRTTVKDKLVIPGDTKREKVKNNWKMWGSKGLLTTHVLFELGIASIIKPISFSDAVPTEAEIKRMQTVGVVEWFQHTAREIAVLDMYDRYYKKGWSTKLTLDVRQKLIPAITKTVTLAWYSAMQDAGLTPKLK
jgi:hypothetical protein